MNVRLNMENLDGSESLTFLDGSMGRVLAERYGLSSDPLFRKVWSSAALIKKEYHRKVIEVINDTSKD